MVASRFIAVYQGTESSAVASHELNANSALISRGVKGIH